jgi:hypothetical protein
MPPAGSFLDQARHELQSLNGRVILHLGVGGAKLSGAGGAGKNDQRDNHQYREKMCLSRSTSEISFDWHSRLPRTSDG